MRLRGKGSPGCHRGGKRPNNGLIHLLVSVTLYSTLDFEKKPFSGLLWQESTKTMLPDDDNSYSI